jgi:hypothetical protein
MAVVLGIIGASHLYSGRGSISIFSDGRQKFDICRGDMKEVKDDYA